MTHFQSFLDSFSQLKQKNMISGNLSFSFSERKVCVSRFALVQILATGSGFQAKKKHHLTMIIDCYCKTTYGIFKSQLISHAECRCRVFQHHTS